MAGLLVGLPQTAKLLDSCDLTAAELTRPFGMEFAFRGADLVALDLTSRS